jgi:integrase
MASVKTYPRRVKQVEQEVFFDLFNKFIADSAKGNRLQKNGQKVKTITIDNYRNTLKHIHKFCHETKFELKLFLVNHLTAKEINKAKLYWQQFYFKFTDFLYKQGHFDNYVGSIIKNIRVFFNYLNIELNFNVGNYHKNFHVPKEDIPIVVLSPDQLKYLIHDKELENSLPKDLRIVKDIFVFGCTVALRVSDMMSIKPYHLVKQDTGYYLKVKSQKTNTDTSIKLPEYAIEIINKYKGKQKTLLPVFTAPHLNRQLKRLAAFVGDKEPIIKTRLRRGKTTVVYKNAAKRKHYTMADHITTHTMRRTAITTMLRLGMPEQVVRKISGHAAHSKEFFKYVAFSQTYQDQETEKVFEKLSEML